VRDELKRLLLDCASKKSGLAEILGVDQTNVSRMLPDNDAPPQGISYGVAMRVAALRGISLEKLLKVEPRDIDFPNIENRLAREAARLAMYDGLPRHEIERRIQDAKSLKGSAKLDNWFALLTTDPGAHPAAKPALKKRGRKKS
jgi:plasmid maintenance system antidote protein VapI